MTVRALIYRPTHRRQLNSSDKIGKYGCSNYSAAMFADAVSCGGVRISGAEYRALSNEPVPNPQSPGLNIPQLITVANILHITMADRTGHNWTELTDWLKQNRKILVQLKNEELRDGTTSDVAHMILLQHWGTGSKKGFILGNNPLKAGAFWYKVDDVKRAMSEFANDTNVPGTGLRYAISRVIPRIAVTT